jgi:hypothetical protein
MKDLQQEVFARMTNTDGIDDTLIESIQESIKTLVDADPIVMPGFLLGQAMARESIITNNKRMHDASATLLWFIGILNITEQGVCSHEEAMEWSDWSFPVAVKEYEEAVNAIIKEELGDI